MLLPRYLAKTLAQRHCKLSAFLHTRGSILHFYSYICRQKRTTMNNKSLWKNIRGYFNALPDKEDETEFIKQISSGVTFHGTYFRYLHCFIRLKCQFNSSDYRRHAHLSFDGTNHRNGFICGHRRLRFAKTLGEKLSCIHSNKRYHCNDILYY